jgi:hypothetical protein
MATEMNVQVLVSLPRTKKIDANAKQRFVFPAKNPGMQRAVPVTVTVGEGDGAKTVKLLVPLTVFGRTRSVKGEKVKVKGDGAVGGVGREKLDDIDMSLFTTLVPIALVDDASDVLEAEKVEDLLAL